MKVVIAIKNVVCFVSDGRYAK